MKTVLISIVTAALLLGNAASQDAATTTPSSARAAPQTSTPPQGSAPQAATQPGPNSGPAGAPKRIAAGSVLPVTLTKTIDAKKAKTGDEVVAKVTQDMKTNSGDVIVAKDTKIMGHVTLAQARSKEQKKSQVAIAFDRAVAKDGSEMQMPMSIQAIIGSQNDRESSGAGSGAGSSPSAPSGTNPNAGRAGATGAPNQTTAPSTGSESGEANETQAKGTNGSGRPQITAQTEGVVGLSDLELGKAATSGEQGSMVSSEKNNVRLESGTLMLLRVNQ